MPMFLLLSIIIFTKCNAYQKDTLTNSSQSEIYPERSALVLSGSALILAAAHIQNYNSWWKGERSQFHFGDGGIRTLNADKAGHFYFPAPTIRVTPRVILYGFHF